MAKIHPLLTALALAALSSAALATGYKHQAGSETWTEAAGLRGSAHVDRLTAPDYFGLQAPVLKIPAVNIPFLNFKN